MSQQEHNEEKMVKTFKRALQELSAQQKEALLIQRSSHEHRAQG